MNPNALDVMLFKQIMEDFNYFHSISAYKDTWPIGYYKIAHDLIFGCDGRILAITTDSSFLEAIKTLVNEVFTGTFNKRLKLNIKSLSKGKMITNKEIHSSLFIIPPSTNPTVLKGMHFTLIYIDNDLTLIPKYYLTCFRANVYQIDNNICLLDNVKETHNHK